MALGRAQVWPKVDTALGRAPSPLAKYQKLKGETPSLLIRPDPRLARAELGLSEVLRAINRARAEKSRGGHETPVRTIKGRAVEANPRP